jgi:hypothetical protein
MNQNQPKADSVLLELAETNIKISYCNYVCSKS